MQQYTTSLQICIYVLQCVKIKTNCLLKLIGSYHEADRFDLRKMFDKLSSLACTSFQNVLQVPMNFGSLAFNSPPLISFSID